MKASVKKVALATQRVVLYVRLSRQDKAARQKGTIESCAVQRADGTAAIESEPGFRLAKVIEHDDLSGTIISRLDEIREMARRKEFEILAIRDFERFARFEEPARTMAVLQELYDAGVRLWDYRERQFVAVTGPEAMVTFVKAFTAGAYVTSNRKNIKDGLRRRALEGQAMHAPPFGYRTNHETMKWEKVDDEVAAVRRVVDTVLRVRAYSAAAMALNRKGVRSPSGAPWRQSMVKAILRQPLYRGEYIYGAKGIEMQAGRKVWVRRDESEWLRVPHPELRILSDEQIEGIDRLLAKPSTPWVTRRRHLASPFLSCSICKGSIVASADSYTCDRHRTHACVGVGFRAKHVINAALLRLVSRLISDDVIAEACAAIRQDESHPDTRGEERERIGREIAAAERRVVNLTGAVAEAASGPERAPLLAGLRNETERLTALKSVHARLGVQVADLEARRAVEALEARVRAIRERLASADLEEQQAAIRAILGEDRVRVSRALRDGRPVWEMRAKADGRFFFGDRADLISDRKQKLEVHGDVTGVTVTPVTASAPIAATVSPAPSAAPAPAGNGAKGTATQGS